LIPACSRQGQADLCEFKASLIYLMSSRPARAMQRDCFNQNKQTNKTNKIDRQIDRDLVSKINKTNKSTETKIPSWGDGSEMS